MSSPAWSCPRCTYHNPPGSSSCEICEFQRYGSGSADPAAPRTSSSTSSGRAEDPIIEKMRMLEDPKQDSVSVRGHSHALHCVTAFKVWYCDFCHAKGSEFEDRNTCSQCPNLDACQSCIDSGRTLHHGHDFVKAYFGVDHVRRNGVWECSHCHKRNDVFRYGCNLCSNFDMCKTCVLQQILPKSQSNPIVDTNPATPNFNFDAQTTFIPTATPLYDVEPPTVSSNYGSNMGSNTSPFIPSTNSTADSYTTVPPASPYRPTVTVEPAQSAAPPAVHGSYSFNNTTPDVHATHQTATMPNVTTDSSGANMSAPYGSTTTTTYVHQTTAMPNVSDGHVTTPNESAEFNTSTYVHQNQTTAMPNAPGANISSPNGSAAFNATPSVPAANHTSAMYNASTTTAGANTSTPNGSAAFNTVPPPQQYDVSTPGSKMSQRLKKGVGKAVAGAKRFVKKMSSEGLGVTVENNTEVNHTYVYNLDESGAQEGYTENVNMEEQVAGLNTEETMAGLGEVNTEGLTEACNTETMAGIGANMEGFDVEGAMAGLNMAGASLGGMTGEGAMAGLNMAGAALGGMGGVFGGTG